MVVIKGGHEFEMTRELLDVTSMHRVDPDWRYVDAAGHVHTWRLPNGDDAYGTRYDPEVTYQLTTLRVEQGDEYWCEDCLDTHRDSWHVCSQCGEKITPGHKADETKHFIAGLATYRIDGQIVSKEEFHQRLKDA